MRTTLILILFSIVLFSCKDEKPSTTLVENGSNEGVFHICEGNFNWNNATLGKYIPSQKKYIEAAYEMANDIELGDVFQSMYLVGKNYWLLVNNSGKVSIVDTSSLQVQEEIHSVPNPRYLASNDNHIFISDIYEDKVFMLDAETFQVAAEINTHGWIEQLTVVGDILWLFHNEKPIALRYNARNLEFLDTIKTPSRCKDLLVVDDKIVTLFDGLFGTEEPSKLWVFDSKSGSVSVKKTFNGGKVSGVELWSNEICVLQNQALIVLSAGDLDVISEIEIPVENINYGFGINPNTNEIFISTTANFTDRSLVYHLDSDGQLIHSYRAGVLCNGFFFE